MVLAFPNQFKVMLGGPTCTFAHNSTEQSFGVGLGCAFTQIIIKKKKPNSKFLVMLIFLDL
jgi:hypothetical protein